MDIFLRALNGLLMVALPIALGFFLWRKMDQHWKIFGIGALTFISSQVVHLPFLFGLTALFKAKIIPSPPSDWSLLFNAIVLGLAAGLCEEIARYIFYRYVIKNSRTWGEALMFGAGHGGIESIVLGLIVVVTLIQMITLRTIGLESMGLPPEQIALAQKQIADYWATPNYVVLLGALERAFAIITHLALSVLVLQTFKRNKIGYLIIAILWHAFIDGAAVVGVSTVGIYWTEAIIAIFSVVNLYLIFAL